jgi:hypothetical protein
MPQPRPYEDDDCYGWNDASDHKKELRRRQRRKRSITNSSCISGCYFQQLPVSWRILAIAAATTAVTIWTQCSHVVGSLPVTESMMISICIASSTTTVSDVVSSCRRNHLLYGQRYDGRGTRVGPPRSRNCAHLLRGGADYYDDSFDTRMDERRNNNSDDQEEVPNDKISNVTVSLKEKSFLSWLFGDLLLNDETTTTTSDDVLEKARWKASGVHGSNNNLSQSTGRGGALVKAKTTLRSRFPWLQSPLEAIRVAPWTARLFRDEVSSDGRSNMIISKAIESENSVEDMPSFSSSNSPPSDSATLLAKRITESVAASAKSVSKVWWVDTWVDHLPDDEEEEALVTSEHVQNSIPKNETNSTAHVSNIDEVDVSEDISGKELPEETIGDTPSLSELSTTLPDNVYNLDNNDEVVTKAAIIVPDAKPLNDTLSKEASNPSDHSVDTLLRPDAMNKSHAVDSALLAPSSNSLSDSPYISSGSVSTVLVAV